mmetsp:Transcript_10303/g.15824  ORF Transcript_10303/g.15824 Transcript_10303/m.15824 type:complete len:105 (+) Transcript_10303:128-442(+)
MQQSTLDDKTAKSMPCESIAFGWAQNKSIFPALPHENNEISITSCKCTLHVKLLAFCVLEKEHCCKSLLHKVQNLIFRQKQSENSHQTLNRQPCDLENPLTTDA